MSDYLRFFILLAAGWINRDQEKIIDYLIEEIRVYQELCKGHRLRFTDMQRCRLGVKARALGRKALEQFEPVQRFKYLLHNKLQAVVLKSNPNLATKVAFERFFA